MVQKIKKVLLPVDGSPSSMKATEYAIDFVKNYQAEIILIHCHRAFPSYLGEPLFQEMISSTMDKANNVLKPYKKVLSDHKIPFTDFLFEEPIALGVFHLAFFVQFYCNYFDNNEKKLFGKVANNNSKLLFIFKTFKMLPDQHTN